MCWNCQAATVGIVGGAGTAAILSLAPDQNFVAVEHAYLLRGSSTLPRVYVRSKKYKSRWQCITLQRHGSEECYRGCCQSRRSLGARCHSSSFLDSSAASAHGYSTEGTLSATKKELTAERGSNTPDSNFIEDRNAATTAMA